MTSKQQLYNRLTTEISQNMLDIAAKGKETALKNQETALKNQAIIARVNAEDKVKELEIENTRLKNLLSKPMEEIAAKNGNFAKTYRKQQELLADWMVNQRAFKELAIQFGLEKGLTQRQVRHLGLTKKLDVLKNKHNPAHLSNATGSSLEPFKEALIQEITDENAKFRAEFSQFLQDGLLYALDDVVPTHWFQVFDDWMAQAIAGNVRAQHNIATCFYKGWGTDIDLGQAHAWYVKAQDQGDSNSTYQLHRLHREPGVLKDEAKADAYFKVALEQGNPRALKEKEKKQKLQEIERIESDKRAQEVELFEQVRTIRIGRPVGEELIKRLKESRYLWSNTAYLLHSASFIFENQKFNKGSLFNRDTRYKVLMTIVNPTELSANIKFNTLDKYPLHQIKASLKQKATIDLVLMEDEVPGSTYEKFTLECPDVRKTFQVELNAPIVF